MDIKTENIGDQNALIKINIPKRDYEPEVKKTLKKYRKNVDMKGFRKGKVPLSIVRKMYGKQVLFEKVNKILQDALDNYIKKEELELVAEPMIKEDSLKDFNADDPGELNVEYEIGLAPDIEVKYPKKVERYKIKIDDDLLNEHIEDLRSKQGDLKHVDALDEDGYIQADFKELTEEGVVLLSGLSNEATFPIKSLKDDNAKKRFQNLKKGDTIKINALTTFDRENQQVAKEIFGTTVEKLQDTSGHFQMTVKDTLRMEKPALDQEFFAQVLGEGEVNSEEEFREKYAGQLEGYYQQLTNDKFYYDTLQAIKKKNKLPLPDEFLKKWLKRNAQHSKEISLEDVENNYDKYAEGIREQLLVDKLMKQNDLKIQGEEVEEYAKNYIRQQLVQYIGEDNIDEKLVNEQTKKLMDEQKFINRAVEELTKRKLVHYFTEHLKIKDKPVTIKEFMEITKQER